MDLELGVRGMRVRRELTCSSALVVGCVFSLCVLSLCSLSLSVMSLVVCTLFLSLALCFSVAAAAAHESDRERVLWESHDGQV